MLKQVIAKRGISVIMAGAMLGLATPGVWAEQMQSCPNCPMMHGQSRTGTGMTTGQTVVVPAGTSMTVRTMGTMPVTVGETFTTQLVSPVVVDGTTVIPTGSQVRGTVTSIHPATNTMDVQFQEVALSNGETIPIRSSATVNRLQGQVVQVQQPALTGGVTTFFPTITWGPPRLSPAARIAASTLGGAVLGAATGTLTGLTIATTSDDLGISDGSATARGLAWGSVYGAGFGLLGGLLAAASDRGRTGVTSVSSRQPVPPTNISTGSLQEIPAAYQTPVSGTTTPVMTPVSIPSSDFVIILEQPATVRM